MDGDNNATNTKQHDLPSSSSSSFHSSLDLSQHVVQQQQMSPRHSPERFRRPTAVRAIRAPSAQGQGIAALPDYAAYGYPAAQPSSSFLAVDSSLQNVALPFQVPLSPESVRQQYSQRQEDFNNYPLHPHRQQQQQPSYDPALVYGLAQPGTAQVPYNISFPGMFQSRSAESLGSMTPQFGVSQYLKSSEHTGDDLTHYLNTQRQSAAYQQETPPNQSTPAVPYSNTMSSYNPVGTVDNMEQQQQQYQQHEPNTQYSIDLESVYRQYQQALVAAFDHTRAGQLKEASKLVVDISRWLVNNAQDLELFQDNPARYQGHLKLWRDLNNCWLSLFQKQKDITSATLASGQQQHIANLLTVETMESMGDTVVQLCDKLEPKGLVDYELGFWEEEIISIIEQCLNILNPQPPQPSQPLWQSRLPRPPA